MKNLILISLIIIFAKNVMSTEICGVSIWDGDCLDNESSIWGGASITEQSFILSQVILLFR